VRLLRPGQTRRPHPEVVVAALEKSASTDPRAEAYVKWQLLSGVDGKFAEALRRA